MWARGGPAPHSDRGTLTPASHSGWPSQPHPRTVTIPRGMEVLPGRMCPSTQLLGFRQRARLGNAVQSPTGVTPCLPALRTRMNSGLRWLRPAQGVTAPRKAASSTKPRAPAKDRRVPLTPVRWLGVCVAMARPHRAPRSRVPRLSCCRGTAVLTIIYFRLNPGATRDPEIGKSHRAGLAGAGYEGSAIAVRDRK